MSTNGDGTGTLRTRRRVLQLGGVAIAGIVAGQGTAAAEQSGWAAADTPTTELLHEVVHSDQGPIAVGDSGIIIERDPATGDWTFVTKAALARSKPVYGADVTTGGERVWFAGDSGIVGEYDPLTDTFTDWSEPNGLTSNWLDVAVQGLAGESERVYLASDSGNMLAGERQSDGTIAWGDVVQPLEGSSIPGLDFQDRLNGHLCSTNQAVAGTDTGNGGWEKVGIEDTSLTFHDVGSVTDSDVTVVADNGVTYYYDGGRWTGVQHSETAIRAVDRDSEFGLAAGAGGLVYEREAPTVWERTQTPVTETLQGVANDPSGTFPDVAVGSSGTVVERPGGT